MAAKFQIVETVKSTDEFRQYLPDLGEHGECEHASAIEIDFGPENGGVLTVKAGTKLNFGNGVIYTLTPPVGWTWTRQRGRVNKSNENGSADSDS